MNKQSKPDQVGSIEVVQFLPFLFRCLRSWYLFVLFIGVAISGAWVYLQRAVPQYQAMASLLIQKDNNSDLVASSTFGLSEPYFLDRVLLADEIEILKSRKLAENVVRSLNLNVLYFTEGPFKSNREISSTDSPVSIEFVSPLKNFHEYSFLFTLSESKDFTVVARSVEEGRLVPSDTIEANSGEVINMSMGQFIAYTRGEIEGYVMINVADPKKLAFAYSNKLEVASIVQSNVLSIAINDNLPSRAVATTQALIAEYDAYVLQNKNQSANRTLNFIDARLKFIAEELFEVEKELEEFKRDNNIPVELSQRAIGFIGEVAERDKDIIDLELQQNIIQGLESELSKPNESFDYILINPNLTEQPPKLIDDYNQLLQQRNGLLSSATRENPRIVSMEGQLTLTLENIRQWLQFKKKDLQAQKEFLIKKSEPINSEINALPTYEREMIEIMRQRGIKEALFTYLLQRKEETSMTLASEVSSVQVINEPFLNGLIWPSKKRIYLIFLIVGIALPTIIVFLREYFDNKLYSTGDIQQFTKTPILGEIPLVNKEDGPLMVVKGSKTVIAEVFRLLRSNLQFLAKDQKQQTIMITSSTSGEGKTFTSINLAASLALSGKSTVLVGMDLRKPKLSEYLTGTPNKIGVTNYLVDPEIDIDGLLQKVEEVEQLQFIDAGPIPPNPNELLMSGRTEVFFNELHKRFDYIIVDSSPVGLVADSLTLKSMVDTTIYVSKFRYTKKAQMAIVEDIYQNKKLPNVAVLLNGIKKGLGHQFGGYNAYSYAYGYGNYEQADFNWWQRMVRQLRGKK